MFLKSTTVGTVELRSIMQSIRYLTRFKTREVAFVEGECTDINPDSKILTVKGELLLLHHIKRTVQEKLNWEKCR
jgi:NADH dehydrogenase FAD-containing subunit